MVTADSVQLHAPPTDPPPRPIISVEDVWKGYAQQAHQISLRHEAARLLAQVLRRRTPAPEEPFWALRGISFTIRAGESVALIGRNGSGKTTLLRVLCGITRPNRGRVAVAGRFAAMIGLGAGFNTERTGRENIFLNAAIHGTAPKQVAGLLDAIIDFAELGEFIDVPVKRYSSGMVTRLGFSIAVHILPDIIFIDEVLAVGDAAFQEKCLARIHQMRAEGRTIVFVSHAPSLVSQVCERAIWLHQGRLRLDGSVAHVLAEYEALIQGQAAG